MLYWTVLCCAVLHNDFVLFPIFIALHNLQMTFSFNVLLKCKFGILYEAVWYEVMVWGHTMCNDQVHEPGRLKKTNIQSLMNSILIGKTPGTVIFIIEDPRKWFSGPNILNFWKHFCSNLLKFDYWGFLSTGLAIFWYNLSENVFRELKYQKKNQFFLLLF